MCSQSASTKSGDQITEITNYCHSLSLCGILLRPLLSGSQEFAMIILEQLDNVDKRQLVGVCY